ncbi:MAG: UDP-N-acetylglucosamine--N-acetylmuramyl-(pentapeptide) pyrophosphoryl-undecaprenol N-acetylglucosamine transferase [Actinomycetota bacterium]|nr:UDP-N-acetylglucosamine--N-acetylmuramyl-(pentapeptide) pyrophosphoryl-undecaprenol N-acetylglucosamine transferase [Actinomycetota bacterium]
MAKRFAIVAGGGTAGHVLPALAVADALVDLGHPAEQVLFVGSRRGQESRLVPEAGFPVRLLPGRGLLRRMSAANIASGAGLAMAAVMSMSLVRRERPAVVLAVGGYASLGPSLAAVALRIPLVLLNVDAVPGAANRLLAPFAAASAVAWGGTALPRATVTGAPLRRELAALPSLPPSTRREARRVLGIPEPAKLVLAVGGSLGSATINTAVARLASLWSDRSDVVVRHVVGSRDWAARPPGPPAGSKLLYQVVEYERNMAQALAAADLVVARAGALTVAELAAAGRPSILVPLPGAPGDHQAANAAVLARVGAAAVLRDQDCKPERLSVMADRLLGTPGRLQSMGAAALRLARPDAADEVGRLVERVALRVAGVVPDERSRLQGRSASWPPPGGEAPTKGSRSRQALARICSARRKPLGERRSREGGTGAAAADGAAADGTAGRVRQMTRRRKPGGSTQTTSMSEGRSQS